MKTNLTVYLIAFLAFSCENNLDVPAPEPLEDRSFADHPKNEWYTEELRQYMRNTNSPGAVMLIDRSGEDLWIGAEGSSNLAHGQDFRADTPFRTGSVTKMLVAVLTMQLVERGQLSLDDLLRDLHPQVASGIPQSDRITLRHLLAHQSGIVDPPNESITYQAAILDDPEFMYNSSMMFIYRRWVFGKRLHFEPGTAYAYSNTNYWLLGDILEMKTGKTLQQLMETEIFARLEMNSSWLEKRDDRNVARGYAELYGGTTLFDMTPYDRAEGDGKADGGLISTANDLQKFMKGLFTGALVGPETLAEMKRIQTPDCSNPWCEYGLGLEIWRTEAGTAYGHNGSLVGIEANVLWYEDTGNILVIYKNNGNFSDKSWTDDLLKP
jgi:D-alanyl-D-alanine carboxypeptidase